MSKPLVIELEGEFDIYRTPELEKIVAPALSAPLVVFDMAATRYVDSSCLSVLVRVHKRRTAAGLPPAALAAVPTQVRAVLSITKLDEIWREYPTVAQACAAASGGRQKR